MRASVKGFYHCVGSLLLESSILMGYPAELDPTGISSVPFPTTPTTHLSLCMFRGFPSFFSSRFLLSTLPARTISDGLQAFMQESMKVNHAETKAGVQETGDRQMQISERQL